MVEKDSSYEGIYGPSYVCDRAQELVENAGYHPGDAYKQSKSLLGRILGIVINQPEQGYEINNNDTYQFPKESDNIVDRQKYLKSFGLISSVVIADKKYWGFYIGLTKFQPAKLVGGQIVLDEGEPVYCLEVTHNDMEGYNTDYKCYIFDRVGGAEVSGSSSKVKIIGKQRWPTIIDILDDKYTRE